MKLNTFILGVCLVCFSALHSIAEVKDNGESTDSILFNSFYVSTNKITTLIFPVKIKNFVVGSWNVNADTLKGDQRVLCVKASVSDFPQTNMTVVTDDEKIYSFLVNYSVRPLPLIFRYQIPGGSNPVDLTNGKTASFQASSTLSNEIQSTAPSLLLAKKRVLFGVHDRRAGTVLKLWGIDEKNDVLYFKLQCRNKTRDNYLIDSIQVIIKDQYKNVLNVYQQASIPILKIACKKMNVNANTSEQFVVAIPKITVPYAKYLEIIVNEKRAGKCLGLRFHHDVAASARILQP